MSRIPEMRPGIRKAIDAHPAISEKTLNHQFENLIFQPLSEAVTCQALGLVVVIDALDECERDGNTILQLLSRTRALKPVSLRIFVTSRPELPIRLGFKPMPDGSYEELILQEVAKQTVEHDIRLFLEHELREIREQRSLSSDWPSACQIQALVEQAVPLFISAATACRYIGDERGNPRKCLEQWLVYQKTTASKHNATYLPIMDRLFNEEDVAEKESQATDFRAIVGSIVNLASPLSVVSLARLLRIDKVDICCRLDSLHSVLMIPKREDGPIRLLHLSFRDFLVDTKKKGRPFWINAKETHKTLASQCYKLMSNPQGLRPDMCNLRSPGFLTSEIDEETIASYLPPELQYTCRYWVHHLEQSEGRINDKHWVYFFLQKHFLHWLETMSIIGEAYKCIHMISRLQTLADVRVFYLSYHGQCTDLFRRPMGVWLSYAFCRMQSGLCCGSDPYLNMHYYKSILRPSFWLRK